jgi:O-antigen/teichoic acid export membrane protein
LQFSPDRLIQLSREALPLGVSASLATINGYLSRLFAVGYLPLNQVGIFSTINYIMNLGIQVSISISAVIMPKLTRHWDESLHKDFNRILLKSLISNLVLGLVGIFFAVFFGQRFLMVVFGPEFARYSDVLIITMIAGTLMYISQPITNAVTAMREFKIQIWASVSVVAASILCGFYLLPRYGIHGAAYMGLITMAVRLLAWIITFLLVRRRHLGLISA